MRLVAWNIRQGGGGRAAAIADALLAHEPDVVVLSEYRPAPSAPILARLGAAGLGEQAASEPRVSLNGVAVASRAPFSRHGPLPLTPLQDERWLELDLRSSFGLSLAALYVPPIRSRLGKPAFWRALLDAAETLIHEEFLLVGDLNTGLYHLDERGATFACEPSFRELVGNGWIDAWRAIHGPERREWSHLSGGHGHRIDHALLSPSLAPRLRDCRYSHAERDDLRLSDHSPLVLDLAAL